MKLVCVDGVSAVGKSTILAEVRRQLANIPHQHTALFITEHITERVFEDGAYSANIIANHLVSYLNLMEQMEQPLRNSKLADRMDRVELWCIWERSWMTHVINQGHAKEDYQSVIDKLSDLEAQQVILTIPEEDFSQRLMSTLHHRNDYWKDYWLEQGSTDAERIQYFKDWQDTVVDLAAWSESQIPTQYIEVPTDSYSSVAAQIVTVLTK